MSLSILKILKSIIFNLSTKKYKIFYGKFFIPRLFFFAQGSFFCTGVIFLHRGSFFCTGVHFFAQGPFLFCAPLYQLNHLFQLKFKIQLRLRNSSFWFWKISKSKKQMLISTIKVWFYSQFVLLRRVDSKQHQVIRLWYFTKWFKMNSASSETRLHPRVAEQLAAMFSSIIK